MFNSTPLFSFFFFSFLRGIYEWGYNLGIEAFPVLICLAMWDNLMPQHFQDIFVSVPFTGQFCLTGEDLFFRESVLYFLG